MEHNALEQDWTLFSLLRFALPTVAMMLFMGLYTVVDTIFVARFVSSDALSAINIVCPILNVTGGLGTMLATGGNAIVSRNLGKGEQRQARENFTLLILTGGLVGLFLLLVGVLCLDQLILALGASELLFPYCRAYLSVLLLFLPANLIQTLFSNLFVTAGKPGLGFGASLLGGLANIIFDYIFIVPCDLGIRGAALGTGIGYLFPTLAGILSFSKCKGPLRFTRPRLRWAILKESCFNGSSEMVGQLATAITTFLFNRVMMTLLGEDGVAAITILIYAQFLLSTLYIGFSMGVAPIFGFLYGKGDTTRLKKAFSLSLGIIGVTSITLFTFARRDGPFLISFFAENTSVVYSIAAEGFSLFAYSFLFCGVNIFTSALFTALSNGRVSAGLSFLRTFVFLVGCILLLPPVWGLPGVWLAVPAAEGITFLLSLGCLLHSRKRYAY